VYREFSVSYLELRPSGEPLYGCSSPDAGLRRNPVAVANACDPAGGIPDWVPLHGQQRIATVCGRPEPEPVPKFILAGCPLVKGFSIESQVHAAACHQRIEPYQSFQSDRGASQHRRPAVWDLLWNL